MSYKKGDKVVIVDEVRFNADFLKNTKRRDVNRMLKHIDSKTLETAYNLVNEIKPVKEVKNKKTEKK